MTGPTRRQLGDFVSPSDPAGGHAAGSQEVLLAANADHLDLH
jgi:hypothetical protein